MSACSSVIRALGPDLMSQSLNPRTVTIFTKGYYDNHILRILPIIDSLFTFGFTFYPNSVHIEQYIFGNIKHIMKKKLVWDNLQGGSYPK